VRITRDHIERYPVVLERFTEVPERDLFVALQAAEAASAGNARQGSPDIFLNALMPMIPVINRFFDDVLVMAEDEKIRHNRLGLVQRIAALAQGVADMSRLEGF
jgi:glycyl-tRNA synthetase